MQIKTDSINPTLANFDQRPDSSHIRPKQCAEILAISLTTFWRLVKSGKIKTHHLTERTTTVKIGDLRKFMNGEV